MNKVMGLAIALISFLSFAAISNAGETITLLDATGAQILSFTYDDATP